MKARCTPTWTARSPRESAARWMPISPRSAPPLHGLRRRPLWWRVRWPIAWAATVTLAVGFGWMLRGGENAGQALVASAEQDTLPQTLGLSRFSEEPRQVAQERAPASRGETPRRQVAVARPQAARADSAAPAANAASGVVPIVTPSIAASDRAPALKPATPAPAVPTAVDGMIVTGVAQVVERGRAAPVLSSTWPIIQHGSATRLLGTELVMIPGVPVKDIRMSPYADGVVLVEQEIDSTLVIQLFQRRADAAAADSFAGRGYQYQRQRAAELQRVERLARFVGPLRVEIAGPLGTDSLSKLLELVK